MIEQRLPMVNWIQGDVYRVSFIDNGRNLEFMFSGADIGALTERIGTMYKFRFRSESAPDIRRAG
mgnify:CR=1 FL=1